MSSYNSEEEVWKLPEQDFTWDVASELALYQALLVHKPAGINKHFNVALVSDGLSEDLGRPVLAGTVWKKLHEMFDLKAVEDREESIPFSLETKEFCLPRKEFESLIIDRQREWKHKKRKKYYPSMTTPTTPKSEGSESRSSPCQRELDHMYNMSDVDLDVSDVERDTDDEEDDEEDEDDNSDECEVESTKSNIDEDEAEKESLLSEAREELERKLSSDKSKEEDKDRGKITNKGQKHEGKKDEEKVAPKRHITRSTPSSTPNKRRK